MNEKLNHYEKKSLLRQILSKMSEYMVQIRLKRLIQNRPFEFSERNGVNADFFWVPRENLNHYYDQDTGYLDENGESYLI
jgi:CRISPR-associated endonuclease/helicase Cas3